MSKNYVLYGELQLNMSQPSKDVGTMVKNIESGTKKSTKNVQSLGGAFGGLSKIIGAATAIGWAFEMQYVLRQMTVDVVRFGAALDHVRTGTEDMARSTGLALGDVASDLREASDYTISLTEAMRQVNQSLLLGGGPTIVENLPELFEIARYNARAMGIDVERALESMVTGLGRVSPRWLDNLGVIIDTRKVYQGFADDAGILVGQMTEAEQRTALIGAIIEKYGALVSDAGESSRTAAEDIEALRVSYKDLAAVVGEAVLSIPAVQALFNTIIDAAQGTVSWTQKTEGQQSALEDFFALMAKGQNQFTSFGKAYHDTFNVGQGEGVQVVEQFIGSIIDSRRAFGEIRGDMDEIITSIAEGDIESGITHWRSFGKEVGLTSKEIKDGVTALRVYYGAWGEFGASAISVQNDYQGILQEQIKESNKAYETAGEKIRAYQNSLVGMGSSAVQSGASMGEVLEIIESFFNKSD